MDEEQQELSRDDRLRALQEELSKLKSLQEHRGYLYFMEIAKAQRVIRTSTVLLNPLKTMDEVLEQEYKKGEIAGITLFENLVEIRMTDIQQQLDEIAEEMKDEQAE